MKILAIFFIAFTAIFNSPSVTYIDAVSTTSELKQVGEVESLLAPEGIIMEEAMMLVNSGDDNNPITGTTIYDELKQEIVYEKDGCYEPFCTFNLAILPTGTYFSVVHTENGKSFNDFIER